jgi:hypothetical protein
MAMVPMDIMIPVLDGCEAMGKSGAKQTGDIARNSANSQSN